MEDDKKKKGAEGDQDTAQVKTKRRWKYVGPTFKAGIYLPDMITLINPVTCPDEDIDAYVARFPKLRGRTWKEVSAKEV